LRVVKVQRKLGKFAVYSETVRWTRRKRLK